MNDIITIDGVKYKRVEEEELEPEEKPKQDPFDIKDGDLYYRIDFRGETHQDVAHKTDPGMTVANACKDKALMEQRALHEILDRLLWRASVQAGELDNPWDESTFHHIITYDIRHQEFTTDYYWTTKSHQIYFPSEESAQSAIDNIVKPFMAEHPDFVW